MLSKDEVKKIAELSRIALSEEEVEKFQTGLDAVLGYVEELKQVDTEGVIELASVTGLENVMRLDQVEETKIAEEIFRNAPDRKDGFYKVKSIL